ncbi:MAG: stringent starvation protein A [Gammaproteobacteria bacterium]|nr:stringent starvation protein A [Gammaproteobacteria bacterium]
MSLNSSVTERRPSMTLLSGSGDIFSHCCRIVLLEKDIECSVEYVADQPTLEKLGEFNPYRETPTLLDRDVALYDMRVILEYLDERFPHPPLMPVDPITRAKTRLMVSRLTRDWLSPICLLGESAVPRLPSALKRDIEDGLTALSSLFVGHSCFLGDDFTMVDAYFGPLLWRLPAFGIKLPPHADPILQYAENLFARSTFHDSLSDQEIELR